MSTTGKSKGCGNRGLRLYIRTFGWPMVQEPLDDFGGSKEVGYLRGGELGRFKVKMVAVPVFVLFLINKYEDQANRTNKFIAQD